MKQLIIIFFILTSLTLAQKHSIYFKNLEGIEFNNEKNIQL